MTNGKFRSVKHRVMVSESEATGERARLSMIYFGGPAPRERIVPVPELMGEGEETLYRSFTWGEYKAAACNSKLGDPRLNPFRLNGEESLP
jgi:gibberellin 2-oxidase